MPGCANDDRLGASYIVIKLIQAESRTFCRFSGIIRWIHISENLFSLLCDNGFKGGFRLGQTTAYVIKKLVYMLLFTHNMKICIKYVCCNIRYTIGEASCSSEEFQCHLLLILSSLEFLNNSYEICFSFVLPFRSRLEFLTFFDTICYSCFVFLLLLSPTFSFWWIFTLIYKPF